MVFETGCFAGVLSRASASWFTGPFVQAGYGTGEPHGSPARIPLKALALLVTIGLQALAVLVFADLLPSFLDDTAHISPHESYHTDSEALFILIFRDRNQAIP
jgi:hypothetical protein